jgi:hypothetical protein
MRTSRGILCFSLFAVATLSGRQSKESSTAVPPMPSDIPANAEGYSIFVMGNLGLVSSATPK